MQAPVSERHEDQYQGNNSAASRNTPKHQSTISKSNSDSLRGANHSTLGVDQSDFAHRVIQWNSFDFTGAQANHVVELSARN
jgi:hypothetical protein